MPSTPRVRRVIARELARAGLPAIQGPGDPILRRTLLPPGSSGVTTRVNSTGTVSGPRPQLNLIEGTGIHISAADDSVNNEIDVTISSDATALLEKRLLFGVARNLAAGAIDVSGLLLTSTATTIQTLSSSPDGRYYNLGTTNINTDSGINSTTEVTRREWEPELTVRHRTGAHANTREWIGFFSANPMASNTPAVSIMGFRASQGVPDTNWQAVVSDGVTFDPTDTGVPFLAGTPYIFRIDCRDTANPRFRVDTTTTEGAWFTKSSNLPAASTDLFYYEMHRVLIASVGTAVNVSFFRIWTR